MASLGWRLGRKLYMWGRGDIRNDPNTNGEYWLLESFLAGLECPNPVLLDIGCNKGEWTKFALEACPRHGKRPVVHAFEPEESAHADLAKQFCDVSAVKLNKSAMSDKVGTAEFFVAGSALGINSMAALPGATRVSIPTTTVDRYCAENEIWHVDFVKSDAEGYDSQIIDGGLALLREGRVSVWQFEYNHRWVEPRRFLRDVFDRVRELPYDVCKLSGRRVNVFEAWHFELERYFEGNYVLVHHDVLRTILHFGKFDDNNVYT